MGRTPRERTPRLQQRCLMPRIRSREDGSVNKCPNAHLIVGLLLFYVLTPGCSQPVKSTILIKPVQEGMQPVIPGIRYALPLRLLKFQIWEAEFRNKNPEAESPGEDSKAEPTKVHFAYLDMEGSRYIPDPEAQFVLSYQGSSLSSDDVAVQVTSNGFLEKIETKFSDQTGEILKTAAEIVLEIAKLQAGGLIPSGAPAQKLKDEKLLEEFEVDPVSPRGLKRFQAVQEDYNGITIEVAALCEAGSCMQQTGVSDSPIAGVFYRPLSPYRVKIQNAGRPTSSSSPNNVQMEYFTQYEQVVLLPNNSPMRIMPITRAAFVEQETSLVFEDGVLTSVSIKKPSEALGFFNALLEPVRIVGRLPGEVFAAILSQTRAQSQLSAQETELLTNMTAYLDALGTYQAKAKESATESPANGNRQSGRGPSARPGR